MPGRDRDILESAVRRVAEQAAKMDALVDEALQTGLGGSHALTVQVKMIRQELLDVKSSIEKELGQLALNCSKCGLDVHWVAGLGVLPGHWAHREPAPHGEPIV